MHAPTPITSFVPLAALVASLSACSPTDDGWTAIEPAYAECAPEPTALGLEDTAPNGQVPASLLEAIPPTLRTEFTYQTGTTTMVTITLDLAAAQARWVDMVETAPSDGVSPAMEMACVDALEITIPTNVGTEDGVFAYAATLTYTVADDGALVAFAQPAQAEVSTTYDWNAHGVVGESDGTTIDGVAPAVDVRLLPDGTTDGAISVQVSGHDDDVAWASNEPIGTW
jgi:hypothetical protein